MAQSLDTLRRLIKTSIHGRRLGLDFDGFLVGFKGVRHVVTNATSLTTGTNLPNHGHITIDSTNARTWKLTDPEVGCEVSFTVTSTSTLANTISPVGATFATSAGTTGGSMILQGGGTGVTLIGLTTGLWGTKSASPGSTYIDLST